MPTDRTPRRPRSFAEALAHQDASRFVGREEEFRELERCADTDQAKVVWVHGRAGIGKSALIRAFARTVGADRNVRVIDDVPAAPDSSRALRAELLEQRPAGLVLVASRRPPDAGWLRDGWESVTHPLELGPLNEQDATTLLEYLGVKPADLDEIRDFARGDPVALVLGAKRRSEAPDGPELSDDPVLAAMILEQLLDTEDNPADPTPLRAASMLASVDERVLAAVVPSVDATAGLHRLQALSVATADDGRVAVDHRVRDAIAVRLRHTDPTGERELRRRLADHLEQRVIEGDATWLTAFPELFRDPDLRHLFATEATRRHRPAPPRRGDADRAADALGVADAAWWPATARWFTEAPQAVTTVRDRRDRLTGFCILITLSSAPAWVAEDPVMAPRLEHARRRYPAGDVLIWRDAFGFPGGDEDPRGPLMVANHAAIAWSGRADALCTYGSVMIGDAVTEKLAAKYGTTAVPELEVVDADRVVTCHVLHHGFGGYAGAARALLYNELGIDPPRPSRSALTAAVRAALRSWQDPVALAGNPLAAGGPVHERAATVRGRIEDALDIAFGSTPEQRLLVKVLEAAHLHPVGSHEEAARRLHLGRSTYFRHLSKAVDQLVAVLESWEPTQ